MTMYDRPVFVNGKRQVQVICVVFVGDMQFQAECTKESFIDAATVAQLRAQLAARKYLKCIDAILHLMPAAEA